MPTLTATDRVLDSADTFRALICLTTLAPVSKFDNRPTWDNWNKKK